MANFTTHWRIGLASSSIGALVMTTCQWSPPRQLPLLILVGWIGSLLPDIDSDTSRPQRLIFGALSAIIPSLCLYRISWLSQSVLRAGLFFIISAFVILIPLRKLYQRYTKHRGVYHSIPAALIYGLLTATFAHHEDASHSLQIALGSVAVVGYLTHLLLDEIWAVDFNGRSLSKKRSFGTALTWRGSRHSRANILLYLTLFLCLRLWWSTRYECRFLPDQLNTIFQAWWGATSELLTDLNSGG